MRACAALLLFIACTPAPIFIGDAPTEDGGVKEDSTTLPDATETDAGLLDSAQEDSGQEDSGQLDSSVPPVTTPYTVDFFGPAFPQCMETLAGMEAAFANITPADLHMTSGSITITDTTAATVFASGQPILDAYGVEMLLLEPNVSPDQPPGTLLGQATVSGAGPLGTHLFQAVLAIDTHATQQNGLAGALYVNALEDGACSVTFFSTITPQ